MRCYNDIGRHIAENTPINSIGIFIKRAARYSMETLGIYFEHLISGITLFYNELYVTDIDVKWKVFGLNMFIYIVTFLGLFGHARKQKINRETRFFLPLYLLVYVFVTMKVNYRMVWKVLRKKIFISVLIVACIVLIWCMTAMSLLSSLEYGVLDIAGHHYITQIEQK